MKIFGCIVECGITPLRYILSSIIIVNRSGYKWELDSGSVIDTWPSMLNTACRQECPRM